MDCGSINVKMIRVRSLLNVSSKTSGFVFARLFRGQAAGNTSNKNPKSDVTVEEVQVLTNPYYKSYQEKIAELKAANPSEYKSRLEKMKDPVVENVKGLSKTKPTEPSMSSPMALKMSSTSKCADTSTRTDKTTSSKSLDDFVKVDMLKQEDASKIQTLWNAYHRTRELVYAVIDCNLYQKMSALKSECSTFVYPLPRKQGFEFFLGQWSGNDCHFTPLLAYQAHQENAPPCLTVHHYTELTEKGLVLMNGEPDLQVISMPDAQLLVHQLQAFYSRDAGSKLVREFTQNPNGFQHMDVIEECQNLSLF